MNKKNTHVVIQTAFIGDVFLTLPLLKKLREFYPQDQIIFVAKKNVAQYLLKNHFIDELLEVSKGDRNSYKQVLRKINVHKNIENVICVHKSFRSALLSFQIKAKFKVGFKQGLNFLFFDQALAYPKSYHDVIRQMKLLTPLNSEFHQFYHSQDWSYLNFYHPKDKAFSEIPIEFKFPESYENTGLKSQREIALFPGSVWPTKMWPLESFIVLSQRLLDEGFQVTLMGGPEEKALAQKIKEQVPGVVSQVGELKLIDSIEYLKRCALVICNDSSPSHLSASQNVPCLAIFGPTTLDIGFRPWHNQSQVVETPLDCRPCGKHGHKKCPLGHHDCMKKISVDDVFNRVLLLTQSRPLPLP